MVLLCGLLDLFLFVSTADSSLKSIEAELSRTAGRRAGLIMGAISIHAHESQRPMVSANTMTLFPLAYRRLLAIHRPPAAGALSRRPSTTS
jgi:hypothetical protein